MKRILLIASLVAVPPCASFAQTPPPRQTTQGFSVTLLLGESQTGSAPEGLSDGARKALADMKDFLPYKSYRVLDTQWIAAGDGSEVTTRVRGVNAQEIDLQMRSTVRVNGVLVSFHLGDGKRGAADASASAQILGQAQNVVMTSAMRVEEVERSLKMLREKYSETHPQVRSRSEELVIARAKLIEAQQAFELAKAGASSAPLIDTSFTMALGETVVVGTSRVQGDKALIVLLTAVPRSVALPTASSPARSVMVTGEVRTPGKIMMGATMSLLEALALAGSATSNASNDVLIVHPPKNGEKAPEPITVNRKDLELGKAGRDITLQDGDIINVPIAKRFFISGFVKSSGSYVLDRNMTVGQVISLAGGMSDRGSDRRIKIARSVNGKTVEIDAILDDKVLPNDEIKVGSR